MSGETEREVDQRGRITLPKAVRERFGIEPGDTVRVETDAEGIVVKPRVEVSRERFIRTMRGCINDETRTDDELEMDPLELGSDWTADLPK